VTTTSFSARGSRARRASVLEHLDAEPEQSGWGFGFSFQDPEGNVWGVAVKYGSDFDDRGGFIYP
jgi:hypothetical protein